MLFMHIYIIYIHMYPSITFGCEETTTNLNGILKCGVSSHRLPIKNLYILV